MKFSDPPFMLRHPLANRPIDSYRRNRTRESHARICAEKRALVLHLRR
jgi:hypothetical protein